MKKPRPKRDKVKHASLRKNYNSKIRQEYIDMDYVDKLDDTKAVHKMPDGRMVTEKEYLAIFMKEYNNGGVGKQSEAKKNSFQRTKALVKESTDKTNKRNVDLWGQAKAMNRGYIMSPDYLQNVLDANRESQGVNSVEDALIEALDNAKELADTTEDSE